MVVEAVMTRSTPPVPGFVIDRMLVVTGLIAVALAVALVGALHVARDARSRYLRPAEVARLVVGRELDPSVLDRAHRHRGPTDVDGR